MSEYEEATEIIPIWLNGCLIWKTIPKEKDDEDLYEKIAKDLGLPVKRKK